MSEVGRFEVRRFAELDSTNAYLLGEAGRGAPEGLVAVAAHQRAGRGRLGRVWESPPGSGLLASVLLRPVLAPADLHRATVALALAGREACAAASGVDVGLKWPNDLVAGGAKLAGVLAEADPAAPGGPPGSVAVVVGIGVNLTWPGPPGAGGTCLADVAPGRAVPTADELLDAVLAGLARRRPRLDDDTGRRALAAEERAASATLGRRVRVETAGGPVEGRAVDLDDQGHLVVEGPAGRTTVAAGDVVHLRPAPARPDGGGESDPK